jgi:hypothetical protein
MVKNASFTIAIATLCFRAETLLKLSLKPYQSQFQIRSRNGGNESSQAINQLKAIMDRECRLNLAENQSASRFLGGVAGIARPLLAAQQVRACPNAGQGEGFHRAEIRQ